MRAPPPTRPALEALLRRFLPAGALELAPQPGGLINDSWLATLHTARGRESFLLQRINRHVFRRPDHVMENLVRVTRHVSDRLRRDGVRDLERRVVQLVPACDGASRVVDERGETWRLLRWIGGARSFERAATVELARATAHAFGRFLSRLQDLPGAPLHETIPAFHDTEARLRGFERTLARDPAGRRGACRPEVEAVLDRRPLAAALTAPARDGALPRRPVHNDAKVGNVLFDAVSGEPLCVVDLDTVMPGLAVHDFGDLVRSSASDSAEDELELGRVAARRPFLEALAAGFVEGAGDALTAAERARLATGALVICYEQAMRFLADHLDGDRYYRIARPGHNLDRARAQLALLASLERERHALTLS